MNHIKNPIKIKIKGAEAGMSAGNWCQANLKEDEWDLWMEPNSWTVYIFEFANKEAATIFALRWAEHAST